MAIIIYSFSGLYKKTRILKLSLYIIWRDKDNILQQNKFMTI